MTNLHAHQPAATKAYSSHDLAKPEVVMNLHFLRMLEDDLRRHDVFDHPFLVKFSKGAYNDRAMRFALIQFSKHICVFTSCLSHLLGMAPTIRDRIVLYDNLQEEMGNGDLNSTHYMLYLRMLSSLQISQEEIDRTPTIVSIDLLNDSLINAIKRSFVHGLAWLGLGGEITIPNNFPYLAQGVRRSYPGVDSTFFERHGVVDQGHSDDSNTLLSMHLTNDEDRALVKAEIAKSLFLRAAVWNEIAERINGASSQSSILLGTL